ncbi:zinc finger protein 281b isoform X2 [Conger conger]|uniref:zinc finger protein 281b isoform X2 n=1 Tax=Conger conger TaxID=82655 RepID=UPI002A5A51FE|nr:zinc finger protein 281b isoform X2 [Conger conger]
MSIIQDKLGNEFLRNGSMEPNFAPGMIMFSHLPPVTSFTRIAAQSVMHDLPLPHEVILKKERDSPDHGGNFVHAMGIKQEKVTEHDYRLPMYGGGAGKSADLLEMTLGSHQNLLVHDLSLSNLSGRLVKDPKETSGRRGRRANGDGQEGKARRKRGESSKSMMLDGEGGNLSPNSKPHICEHCNAAFRSSYHLRRHVLIHTDGTGERPFRCSQCNMSFIQKYLLQRHEKIHSGEKPFSCDQCNMRFIQKYHMERHKRTHSGEKPYKCDTCQQYFSRTDRLLKHKRTCGEAIKKGMDPGMLDQGGEMGQGSYAITQGNANASGRKRGKSKNAGEGGERKKKKSAEVTMAGGLGLQDYAVDMPSVSSNSSLPCPSMHVQQGRSPKLMFKKVGRKGDKGAHPLGEAPGSLHGQKLLQQKASAMDLVGGPGMDNMGLLQAPGAKQGPTSSNYDDAMQFLKKRRYLHAVNSDYGPPAVHMPPQQSVIQGVMDSEASLNLLDPSPLGVDIKHDKSGIPDEVLQSLLDHYSQKPDGSHDVPFDLADQHVDLHPASGAPDLGQDEDSPSSSGDKTVIMNEYSKFLLQALERTSHSSAFPLGPAGPFPSLVSSSAHPGGSLFSDKQVYTTSPLECGFSQSVTSTLPNSLPKSHFGMLVGSSQPSFHLSSLEPAHQQLTPSQELTDQIEKQHSPAYQMAPQELAGQKDRQPKSSSAAAASSYQLSPQDLAQLDPSKGVDMRSPYQIENFAQAFGSQFKAGSRVPLAFSTDSSGEVDHRIRTPVSEFSGYTNLLADVNEPVSTGSKTPTSQSYR